MEHFFARSCNRCFILTRVSFPLRADGHRALRCDMSRQEHLAFELSRWRKTRKQVEAFSAIMAQLSLGIE